MKQPTDLFKAFADATRVRLLNLLAQREHCVCEFQSILCVPQPKISRHLAYLRRAGLVRTRRDGKWIYYSLAPAGNAVHTSLLRWLRGCFTEICFLQRDLKRDRRSKPMVRKNMSGGCHPEPVEGSHSLKYRATTTEIPRQARDDTFGRTSCPSCQS